MRYTPRSSVTPTNLVPCASFVAVTVTPGSTPPVLSRTVPVTVESCARATSGSANTNPTTANHTNRHNFIEASFTQGVPGVGAQEFFRVFRDAQTLPAVKIPVKAEAVVM